MGKFFKIQERGSSVGQELRAGLTTFLAMAYIIAVNPGILVVAGIPLSAAITATCIGAGVMTICMGLFQIGHLLALQVWESMRLLLLLFPK